MIAHVRDRTIVDGTPFSDTRRGGLITVEES